MNQPDEASIRAAVIVGILRYTQMPLAADAEVIRLCSVGAPYSQDKLSQVSVSLRVQGYSLDFSVIPESNLTTQRLQACDVLIVGKEYEPSEQTLTAYSGLSICDGCNQFIPVYVVELIKADKRIGFNVNLDQANRFDVNLSSSLLELASKIRRSK